MKYRRTVEGDAVAAGSLAAIEERLESLPLAKAVMASVAEGPRTLFAIQGQLVEQARKAVRAGKNTEWVAPHRPELLSVVRLLAELGLVRLTGDGMVQRL